MAFTWAYQTLYFAASETVLRNTSLLRLWTLLFTDKDRETVLSNWLGS